MGFHRIPSPDMPERNHGLTEVQLKKSNETLQKLKKKRKTRKRGKAAKSNHIDNKQEASIELRM